MYMPKHFAEDEAAGLAAIAAYPFAMLVTWSADGPPAITHAPLLLDPEAPRPTLLGHVARANPQGRALETAGPARAVFTGPNAYVSPNWYPSKRAGGQAVPTWNYVAVEVAGTIRPLPDLADKRRIVRDLSIRFEGDGPDAWRLDDEPEDFVRKMLGGIVAFALEIETIETKAKLSQNRSERERRRVADEVEPTNPQLARAMRDAMASMGGDPNQINPLQPAEMVIDHSVVVDKYGSPDAADENERLEFERKTRDVVGHGEVRYVFDSDDGVNNSGIGWLIDDVLIDGQ